LTIVSLFLKIFSKHKQAGLATKEAATLGASELFIPILGSYLTTVAAFLPLAFMSGIMGRFHMANTFYGHSLP
jgi:multidrug efflux pump subunit AcrB